MNTSVIRIQPDRIFRGIVSLGQYLVETVIFQHMYDSRELYPLLGTVSVVISGLESILFFQISQPSFHIEFFISVFCKQERLDLLPFTFIKLDGYWIIVIIPTIAFLMHP